MKHSIIIAVAVLSLLVAIPLSKTADKPNHVVIHTQAPKVSFKVMSSITPPILPVPVAAAKIEIQLPNIACAQYAPLFEQYSWDVHTAVAICQAESSGNPNPPLNGSINYDGVSDYGLMQLHGVNITDPAENISYAYYHKYLTQGWNAWSTFKSGKYQQFL